jgi:hypothetical protein
LSPRRQRSENRKHHVNFVNFAATPAASPLPRRPLRRHHGPADCRA